ncbi:pyridoxal-dependent decarboxylase [Tenacibaculum sp.]|nr:pyridoxal-dependent decarboxylase [Tenacibaculum sp.]
MNTNDILTKTLEESLSFLKDINHISPNIHFQSKNSLNLPKEGVSFNESLSYFKNQYGNAISATAGPRYFGYVVGGATPPAIAGDWLTSVYDQVNPAAQVSSVHEHHTLAMLLDLFQLPKTFEGSFVSGATMSNMVNLGTARQWYGLQKGVDIAKNGLFSLKEINIFSANAHSSSYKALSMLGIGRNALTQIDQLPNREAIDIMDLEKKLTKLNKEPAIVIASAGTVNTTDFDNFSALKQLKEKYNFWLHIDGAFGGFASCSPKYEYLIKNWEYADSITIDAHKWMNVPYDSAFQFTKHMDLQQQVFQNNNAPYVKDLGEKSFINITPQGSRRWRSLPTWFSLMNLGKKGYQNLIEKNCNQAKKLGNYIRTSSYFDLMAEVNLNTVCFKVSKNSKITTELFLQQLNDSNKVFLTPTIYQETFSIRCAICNWMTTEEDIDILIDEMKKIMIAKNILT